MAYTITKAAPSPSTWVATISTAKHDEIRPAEHEGIEINFASSSALNMRVGLRELELMPNQLVAFSSRQEHTEFHKKSSQTHRAIIFRDEYLANIFGGHLPSFEKYKLLSNAEVNLLAHEIHQLSFAPYVPPTVFENLCDELTLHLFANVNLGYHPTVTKRIKRRLYDNLENSDLNLTQLASEFGMSKFHFLRSFKNVEGLSPMRYLRKLRAEWFGYRLAEGKRSVTDTAFLTGFGSLSSFYDSFSREMKISPRVFLDQVVKNPNRIQSDTYSYLTVPI